MAGRAITVAQQKGGSGKTTLAVNLAVALYGRGHTVAVLDTDPQGSMGRWFMTRRDAMEEPGIEFATASAWGVGYECEKLKKHHDFVIIDTPPKIDSDLRPALRESALVLVPVATSHVDLWATESVLELTGRVGCPVLMVLNRASSRAKLTAEVSASLDELDAPRAQTALASRVIYAEVLGEGTGVTERTPRGPAALEVQALLDEIGAVLDG
ncbi:ParA family partition ATPase [Meridianimarinicoccus aquatilis]|uniref:ParA family protein n=1 Tax=Meridianimarinicoccus aquatilis TaxID=2552766 RepID=A0A4R6AR55_9RHOB|nr:ParA family partition ATPase [Fluviibacterium aquatile]QIE41564.1 ParA family protein [Rhodobacteraceae bacterium SC52]TDL86377.1 ParA family protein [Fluviibacterium aquatile]